MVFENTPRFHESGVDGPAPVSWYGRSAPDGDAYPFLQCPVGTLYVQTGTDTRTWQKVGSVGADSDWVALGGQFVIVKTVARADFTDGGAALGTYTLPQTIPAGAWVSRAIVTDVTGFTGDTSAVLDIGDGTDDDRYNASAGFNVFGNSVALDGGAPQGTQVHTAAKQPVLTLTSATDFTAVAAGSLTVKIFYNK